MTTIGYGFTLDCEEDQTVYDNLKNITKNEQNIEIYYNGKYYIFQKFGTHTVFANVDNLLNCYYETGIPYSSKALKNFHNILKTEYNLSSVHYMVVPSQ